MPPLLVCSASYEERTVLMKGSRSTGWRDDARFSRAGGVPKNRARLNTEQAARIVERARAELEPGCFAFLMTLPDR
jgi:hypothetical protein